MQSTLKKILVVEDEPQVRENIASILAFEGFYRIAAENGLIGLQWAKEELPDLIICDIMMPELDGYEFIQALRQDPETACIPIILLTAKADRGDQRHGMELGADDYLTKPFTPAELRRAIQAQFEKQKIIAEKTKEKFDRVCNTITLSLPHELHVPLQNIIGLPWLLIEDWNSTSDEEKIEMLKEIGKSGEQLYNLTQNFLLYANLEMTLADSNKIAIFREHTPQILVKSTIEEIALQEARIAQRTTDLQMDLQEAVVQISRSNLQKVVKEVINNAFKFSQPGSCVRLVGFPGNETYSLYIMDLGCGMSAAQIASMGAYVQFNNKLYGQHGTGLGLAVAKRLIELYEGTLNIESIPNRQTVVRITLPMTSIVTSNIEEQ